MWKIWENISGPQSPTEHYLRIKIAERTTGAFSSRGIYWRDRELTLLLEVCAALQMIPRP